VAPHAAAKSRATSVALGAITLDLNARRVKRGDVSVNEWKLTMDNLELHAADIESVIGALVVILREFLRAV
jgi:hypothetical protein